MFTYDKLEVYKLAFAFHQKIYKLFKANNDLDHYVKENLGNTSLSIMLKIAEGSGKFSRRDRRILFTDARAAAFACHALLSFVYQERALTAELKTTLSLILDEISKTLSNMVRNLMDD